MNEAKNTRSISSFILHFFFLLQCLMVLTSGSLFHPIPNKSEEKKIDKKVSDPMPNYHTTRSGSENFHNTIAWKLWSKCDNEKRVYSSHDFICLKKKSFQICCFSNLWHRSLWPNLMVQFLGLLTKFIHTRFHEAYYHTNRIVDRKYCLIRLFVCYC